MSQETETLKHELPVEDEQPAKRRAPGNFTVRDRAECHRKLPAYSELVKDARAADPRDLKWKMGEGRSAGELVVYNKTTGRETAVLEGFGDCKIFTTDPEKLNVKLSLDEARPWDKAIIDLFRKRLPEAVVENLKALTAAKDGCKPLISKKQAKSIKEKAESGASQEELYQFIWEDIILDESGPHIPIKFWTDKNGEEKVQLSTTHKNITPAYDGNKPLGADDIKKLPGYVQPVAEAKLGEGIVYHPIPMTGTNGEPVDDVTECPNFSGTVNFVGKVQIFLAGIKAQKIKWTTCKVTGIQVLGFGAGAEAPVAISANSLFND